MNNNYLGKFEIKYCLTFLKLARIKVTKNKKITSKK